MLPKAIFPLGIELFFNLSPDKLLIAKLSPFSPDIWSFKSEKQLSFNLLISIELFCNLLLRLKRFCLYSFI